MPKITLRLVDSGSRVEFVFEEISASERSEIEFVFLQTGAISAPDGLRVDVFEFRRRSPDLGSVLASSTAELEIEASVQQVLQGQLDEIRARQSAEGLLPLSAVEVDELLRTSGRFVRALTPEQIRGLGKLLALMHGANFSVPGAGKTAMLLAIYESLRGLHTVDRLLVVAPKNAFASWDDEISQCFNPDDYPHIVRAQGGRTGVSALLRDDPEAVIISYQLLPNALDVIKDWARQHSVHAVLDESHRVKAGYGGVYASAALELAGVARRRDILSGTPLPHQPEDLRPQLDFLWPGQRILPNLRLVTDSPQHLVDEVADRLRPLYTRTTKAELHLPDLVVRPEPVLLTPMERELYELLRSEAARAAAGMESRDRQFFRALGRHVVRLIQAATNPMLLTQGALVEHGADPVELVQNERARELLRSIAAQGNSAKVGKAIELTESAIARGERVLIWSNFIMNIRLLETRLAQYEPVVIMGEVPTGSAEDAATREGRVRRFHDDPSCRVLIANPAAAGEGISLHRTCHYAIYLDRNFNAAHYLQSIDRIHRLGSNETSRVDVLQAIGTIDSRIVDRLNSKIEAMRQILNDDGLRLLAYDPDDVEEVFGAGIEMADVDEIAAHLNEEPDGE